MGLARGASKNSLAVIVSLLFLFSHEAFARETTPLPTVETYDQLVHGIRAARARSRQRVEQAVEQEKVREAWEIGKLIDVHVLHHKERANYDEQVLARLATDLEFSQRELYYMLRFARLYPILTAPSKLTWSHYRELLSVNDAEKRREMAKDAVRKKWSQKELRREIRKLKTRDPSAVSVSADEPLVPIKGKLDTYRILIAKAGEWKRKPVIDLGFSNYLNHPALNSGRFKEGDIIRVDSSWRVLGTGGAGDKGEAQRSSTAPQAISILKDATEADLFTYRAYVFEITDGDTLWVLIDLGFGVITQQHLRLRGLDAPEIASREGVEAKRFIESELKNVPSVLIASTKSDKYDRYLADIFYQTKSGEQFLNNRLLEEKLAHRV